MAEWLRHPRLRLTEHGYRKLCRLIDERDGGCCRICGSHTGLQHHHVVFRSAGGDDREDNLILLCWRCHDAYAHGPRLKSFRDMFKEYLASDPVKAWRKQHRKELEAVYKNRR